MYNFLVLGIVPGTNVQITFLGWIVLFGLSLLVYGLDYRFNLRQRLIDRLTAEFAPVRVPLHATQLHQRG